MCIGRTRLPCCVPAGSFLYRGLDGVGLGGAERGRPAHRDRHRDAGVDSAVDATEDSGLCWCALQHGVIAEHSGEARGAADNRRGARRCRAGADRGADVRGDAMAASTARLGRRWLLVSKLCADEASDIEWRGFDLVCTRVRTGTRPRTDTRGHGRNTQGRAT